MYLLIWTKRNTFVSESIVGQTVVKSPYELWSKPSPRRRSQEEETVCERRRRRNRRQEAVCEKRRSRLWKKWFPYGSQRSRRQGGGDREADPVDPRRGPKWPHTPFFIGLIQYNIVCEAYAIWYYNLLYGTMTGYSTLFMFCVDVCFPAPPLRKDGQAWIFIVAPRTCANIHLYTKASRVHTSSGKHPEFNDLGLCLLTLVQNKASQLYSQGSKGCFVNGGSISSSCSSCNCKTIGFN